MKENTEYNTDESLASLYDATVILIKENTVRFIRGGVK